VTDPLTITSEATLASRVKWEFPKATTAAADVADMGYSFSRPAIVNTAAGWVVLFGNGYNSPNEHAVLFVLSTSGTVLAKIDTLSGPSNGLSTPAVVDVNSDSLADYVYVGDLLGNLWKFDIQAASAASWKSAYESSPGVPAPLFTARGPGGAIQPITTKPDAMYHCKRHGTIVVFGTGKYLGSSDFADVSTQTLYGIWDYGDDSDDAEYLGTFNRATVPNLSNQPASVSLLEQVELVWASFGGRFMRVTSDYAPTWATEDESPANGGEPNLSSATSNHAGWYFDLPLAKERIIRDLQIRSGMAIVITTIPKSIPCTAGGESILMEIQACTGARPYSPQLDINEDGLIDENDKVSWNSENLPPSGLHSPTLLYEPTILRAGDQELKLMSTAAGGIVTQRERGEGRGMFYWREIK
jgi:type IV pilus assembly protein PilY1